MEEIISINLNQTETHTQSLSDKKFESQIFLLRGIFNREYYKNPEDFEMLGAWLNIF